MFSFHAPTSTLHSLGDGKIMLRGILARRSKPLKCHLVIILHLPSCILLPADSQKQIKSISCNDCQRSVWAQQVPEPSELSVSVPGIVLDNSWKSWLWARLLDGNEFLVLFQGVATLGFCFLPGRQSWRLKGISVYICFIYKSTS